jgi:hypothetical protein
MPQLLARDLGLTNAAVERMMRKNFDCRVVGRILVRLVAALAGLSLSICVTVSTTAMAQTGTPRDQIEQGQDWQEPVQQGLQQVRIHARVADKFVDSLGINVHMEYSHTPYGNYPLIDASLRALGMRHFRDEINDTNSSFVDEINAIGKLGYTLCGVIAGGNDYPPLGTRLESSAVVPMIHNLQPTIEAVEGPNEPDDGGFVYDGVPYPQGAINESVDLWHIVKDSSEIGALPVLAMSEGNAQDFTELAKLVKLKKIPPPIDYTSYGNMHAYQNGGLGDDGLSWFIHLSQDWTGSELRWTTEMGYHNNINYVSDGEQQGVSQRASAIYLPIAFLSGFDRGVSRTFSYELIDEVKDPCLPKCSGEGSYGLLNYDGTVKPAYTALKSLIALLREPGVKDFEPGSLTITFSGAPSTMRYILLQKSSGYYLALWNDVSVYQVATQDTPGVDLYPENVPITLTFSASKELTIYAPNDASDVNPTDAYTISKTPSSINLDLPPKVLLIKIVGDS